MWANETWKLVDLLISFFLTAIWTRGEDKSTDSIMK